MKCGVHLAAGIAALALISALTPALVEAKTLTFELTADGTLVGGRGSPQGIRDRLSDTEKAVFVDNIPVAMTNLTRGAIEADEKAVEISNAAGVVFADPDPDPALVEAVEKFKLEVLERAKELAVSRGVENSESLFATFQELIAKWDGKMKEIGNDWDAYAKALDDEIYSKLV